MPGIEQKLGRVLIPMATPFRANGRVDYGRAGQLAKMLLARGRGDALVLAGTTGEFYALSDEERVRLFRAVKQAVGAKAPLVAGTGAASTQQALALSKAAERMGFAALLVVAPYYSKATQEGLYRHFRAIAQAVKLPVLLYNIPLFAGVNIAPETVGRLARFRNIVGLKEEAGVNPTQTTEFLQRTPRGFAVYCGDDTMVLAVLAQGGVGCVSAGAHLVGDRMKEMIAHFLAGRVREAAEIHHRLFPLFQAFLGKGRVSPIPLCRDAVSLTWKDLGPPRLPLVGADAEEKRKLIAALKRLGRL
jgi:4-hydroxy-tetrahydrodipicolinate synthase